MTQLIDSVCDCCEKTANWRIRDRDGNIRAAACNEHKAERRIDFYASLQQAKAKDRHHGK